MARLSELRVREVVNTADGRRLGVISDLDVDLTTGRVTALILPGAGRLLGIFGRDRDIVVPWQDVRKIGADVILVDLPELVAGPPLGGGREGPGRAGGEPPR